MSLNSLFQFHDSTIKTCSEIGIKPKSNFNSIMVQLKQRIVNSETCKVKFQFHNGTIKTNCQVLIFTLNTIQFHNGTIKTPCLMFSKLPLPYFNSIMVQLKLKAIGMLQETVCEFQFHNGTIKTRYDLEQVI